MFLNENKIKDCDFQGASFLNFMPINQYIRIKTKCNNQKNGYFVN